MGWGAIKSRASNLPCLIRVPAILTTILRTATGATRRCRTRGRRRTRRRPAGRRHDRTARAQPIEPGLNILQIRGCARSAADIYRALLELDEICRVAETTLVCRLVGCGRGWRHTHGLCVEERLALESAGRELRFVKDRADLGVG